MNAFVVRAPSWNVTLENLVAMQRRKRIKSKNFTNIIKTDPLVTIFGFEILRK